MGFKDILLSLATFPDATPAAAIESAAALSRRLEARLSAVIWELKLERPGPVHFLADALLHLPRLIEAEMSKSAARGQELARAFKAAGEREDVLGGCLIERCAPVKVPDFLAEHGRFHDLTVVPVMAGDPIGPMHAEAAIFGAGHPTLVLPESAFGKALTFERVLIACDFGRPAARAIADAMPLIRAAREVHVVTVVNEKPLTASRTAADLKRHLSAHGVAAEPATVDAAGRKIGEVLTAEARGRGADLLVMGAYGHSRLQEFVLGGATNSMVRLPPVPVLMSH